MNREAATGETPLDDAAKEAGSGDKKVSQGSVSDSGAKGKPSDVGNLLRGAYRETVEEAIPDDLMDLLNKLE